jgi:hypothetical protein
MFNALAIPEIVGFVGLPFEFASFFAASVSKLINSLCVSGFLTSIPDIYSLLRVENSRISYLKVSDWLLLILDMCRHSRFDPCFAAYADKVGGYLMS